MPTKLHAHLDNLAHLFASAVLQAIRSAPVEDLLAESGRAPRDANARAKGPPGRLPRRSAEDIASTLDRVVATVKKSKTGLRAEEIRKALGLDAREMPRVLKEGLANKKLRSKGQKRATTYFAR